MTRLYILVEGQTEEEFVKSVLTPHLATYKIWVSTLIVQTSRDAFGRKRRGGGQWKHWLRDLQRLTREQAGADVRFTTMFDLYGLPDDFPGIAGLSAERDTARRADHLAEAMARVVDDARLIPYLQRHEFEALVLAGLPALGRLLEDADDLKGLQALQEQVARTTPEEINDGPTTAPSKRLQQHIPSYRKTVHGPLAVEETGLAILRASCPRFHAWVLKLEAVGEQPS